MFKITFYLFPLSFTIHFSFLVFYKLSRTFPFSFILYFILHFVVLFTYFKTDTINISLTFVPEGYQGIYRNDLLLLDREKNGKYQGDEAP